MYITISTDLTLKTPRKSGFLLSRKSARLMVACSATLSDGACLTQALGPITVVGGRLGKWQRGVDSAMLYRESATHNPPAKTDFPVLDEIYLCSQLMKKFPLSHFRIWGPQIERGFQIQPIASRDQSTPWRVNGHHNA